MPSGKAINYVQRGLLKLKLCMGFLMKRLIQSSLIFTLILIGLTGWTFAAPTITSFTPASGTGGSSVTITGTNFTGATSVLINGVSVSSFIVNSSTQIVATVPDNATTGKISIIGSGSVTSTSDFTIVPTLSSMTPSSAPRGTSVVFAGTNFSGITSVKFNGITASFTINSATQITATVPTRANTGKITIATTSSSTQSSSSFIILTPPNVSRFTPTKGAAGTAVSIIGSNFDLVTAVSFNGEPATFTIVSSTQIQATLPITATKGKITVTNSAGSDVSGTSFTVLPGIRSFTPSTGTIGSSVTIIGTALSGARSVKFNGTSSSFTETSDTSLTAIVPTRATSGSLTVTTAAGTTSGGNFTVESALSSFTPASGVIGTRVNLSGTNFGAVTGVQFNGVSATYTRRSATLISAIVPSGASTGFITLTTAAGTVTSSSSFTVTGSSSGLALSSFSPTSGAVGATVILTGAGFSDVTDVMFNNVSSSFTVNSTTKITALVPASASTGQLTVVTSSGYALSTSNFSVIPQISNFSPTSGGTGTSVVITGSGLAGTNSIKFNGVSAGFTVNSATQVTATVPSSASTGKIILTTPSGSVTTTSDYTVVSAPTLTSFSPTRGATGSSITVYGSNFVSPTVTVGGVSASVTVVSASQLSVTIPETATSGAVVVTTSAGTATSSSQFTVTPTVTSFTPSSGIVGSSVVITGTGFGTVTNVTFNGRSSSYTVNSSTQITATVPTSATTGPISVTTSAGSASTATNFTVTTPSTPPTISSFSPTSGQVGTSVTITGTNFTGATAVQFNGVSATTFTVVSATQITATLPSGASSGKISVTTSGGTVTSTASFSVTASQVLTSFSPTSGPIGTTVTIIGTNLSGVTAVQFNGVSATTFSILSATQISATVPSDASSGKITLVSLSGNSVSTANFSVVPTVTGFTPTTGPAGTTVVITGSGFTGTTAVKFNSTTTTFTTNSANQITASAPSGATTGKIYVVTPSGTAASTSNFTMTAPPSIVGFTPTRGAVGSTVIITGGYLTATDVQFNGVSTTFTQVTSSQINAVVPNTATTGKITVIATGGTVTTTGNYTITPGIASFSPTSGAIGTTVVITGSGFSSVTTVSFNNKSASFTVDSPNQITTIVPAGASTGSVAVSTSAGTATGTSFYVTPTIGSFSPTTGTIGTTVFLNGSGFNNVTSVQLNGSAVTYTVNSSTSIRVTLPIGSTSGTFSVTTTSGSTTSSSSFTVIPPISITSFTPACAEIGNTVTITGVSFIGVTEVLIDTSFCLFTVPSSTEIVVTVPATATTGRIKVISSLGVAMSATDFVPVNVPDIISYSPLSGPVGTTVVLYGTGYCLATSVDFNGTFTSFTIDSDVQITTTVPFGATTGAITVINTVGSFTTPTNFIVTPDIISFNPTSGYVGDDVILTGTNFTGATDVSFNGVSATFTVDSYSQVTTTVPVGATTGFITITTPDGTDATPTVYAVLPRIDNFTPTTGIVGDLVTINGSGLNSATSVTFNGTSAGYTIISEAQIDAVVPFGATTGTISVTTPVGSATSSSMFSVEPNITGFTPVNGGVGDTVTIFGSAFTGVTEVQFNGVTATFIYDSYSQVRAIVPSNSSTGTITLTTTSGSDVSAGTFTVLPKITNISPTSGVIGSTVLISGTTFTATTDVSFNGTAATYTVISDILISATVPSGATTGTISVTTPDGTDYSSQTYTVLPDVASFTPTSGEVGDPVTINGTGFTGATSVQFNGTNSSFTVNSDIDISATVPNGATTGLITVVTPSGTNSSTSNFDVLPTITSFTPGSGIPGTSVTIVGYAFTGATVVAFNGTNATFTIDSYNQITATVPAGATTGTITVTTPSGTATSATSFALEPNITGFAPTTGIIGQTITVTGTNFTGATDVTFNGVSAITFTVVSSTQIDVVVPAGASTGLIAVTTPDGTDNSSTNFTVIPDVGSFTPASGEVGDVITINGSGFTGATSVSFNGTSASFTVNSDIDISATVPNGATTGLVTVVTPSGPNTSSTNFTVVPTITGFVPGSGIPGTSVVITGYAFTGATAVAFNGTSTTFTVDSYSQITAAVPAGATTGTITVTTPSGTATSATSFLLDPNITSFTPTSGIIGQTITIIGTNFTGTTDVSFNGESAITFTVISATQIDAVVPVGATTGFIQVTNPDGTDISATNFSVIPDVQSFLPTTEEIGNQTVITGTSFTGATSVTFNGTSSSFVVDNDGQITATVPVGATSGTISVTTPSGTGTSSSIFGVEPTVASFFPSSGNAGASIVITGTGFSDVTTVNFNAVSASFTINSATQITATVPAGASTGPITVTNPALTATSGSNFLIPPTITGLSASSGVIGATITITGTIFTGVTNVSFNGVSATYTVNSITQIDADVPAGATTGTITVTNAGGMATSSTFTVLPDIISFAGTSGPVGTSVVITGTAFTGASSVTFGGVSASYTVNSSTQITATVPAGANTGSIAVTTAAGVATSATTYSVTPSITGFSPSSGAVGATVTINGQAFTGVTAVAFNGTSAAFTFVSNTQITATVPAAATTGTISVTTPSGTGTSGSNFSVLPVIGSFSPSNGVIGSVVTVTGTTLTGATAVTINGVNAPSYTVVSSTQIDITVPAGATTGLIAVTTPSGTATSASTYTVKPNIVSFAGTSGPVGTSVVITGTAFTGATSVTFGGVSASYTVNSSTQITATVPAGANTGSIVVVTAGGTATSATTYAVTPSITSFSPSSGPIGTSVTINGQAFTGATGVAFNGTNATFTVVSNIQITATVPAGASTGTIAITTPSGSGTSGSSFTVTATISGFAPASGIVGSSVIITGTGFFGVTAVRVNGVNMASFTVDSPTQITAAIPTAATSGLISVTTAGGTANSASNFSIVPSITSLGTTSGPVGTSVTINGSGFGLATAITFNGVSATFSASASPYTSITATVPAGATTGTVSVTTPGGTGTSATNFTVTPTVSSFSPTSGVIGSSVTINGQAFTGATSVTFNGTSASFTVVNNLQITATVPAGASTGTIAVTTPSGTGTSGTSYTVTASVSSFAPASGIVGSSVIITGTGFFGVTNVRVNGVNMASFTVDSPTQITAAIPTAATSGLISVTTAGGTANSASNFSIVPNITSLGTTSGPVGTSVTINGSGFGLATAITFNGVSATFSASASPYTSITATVPTGATTGTVSVTTPGGTGTSATNFTVTPTVSSFSPTSGAEGASITINGQAFTGVTAVTFNGTSAVFSFVSNTQITATVPVGATTGTIAVTTPSGTGTSGSNFSVLPSITGFSPSSGVIGSVVTVTGTTLTGATSLRVNGVNVASYTVVNSTQIDLTVPASATSGLISVTTPGGTANSASNYTVLPNITGFSVASGVVGTGITINGSAFTGATSVKFNGVSAAFTVATSTSITTTVPTGASTGFVTVTNPNGTATSASMFIVPPTVTSFGPGSGLVGDSIIVTGEGFTGATSVTFNGTSAGFIVLSSTSIKAAVPAGATDGTIAVTTPSGSATSGVAFDVLPKLAVLDNLNAMLLVDSKGFERRLFFGKVPQANVELAKKYELRPIQKGIFDVRFASSEKSSNGKLIELYSSVPATNLQYRMNIESATYPLTVYFDRGKGQLASVKVWSVINGNISNPVELQKNGSVTITDASVSELVIEIGQEVVVPKEFALEQNYPNPFNPTTTIRYALPGTYYVSLKIYNMLGEEVADLVNEQKDAGAYEFNWNANNMATGVYTYRLVAFDASNHSKQAFVQVKKMLLIK